MTTLTQMCHCYGNSMPNTQHITAVPYTYTTSYIQYMNNKKIHIDIPYILKGWP